MQVFKLTPSEFRLWQRQMKLPQERHGSESFFQVTLAVSARNSPHNKDASAASAIDILRGFNANSRGCNRERPPPPRRLAQLEVQLLFPRLFTDTGTVAPAGVYGSRIFDLAGMFVEGASFVVLSHGTGLRISLVDAIFTEAVLTLRM